MNIKLLAGMAAVVFAGMPSLFAQNLLSNGDFGKGTASWAIFAPHDAKDAGASFAVVEGGRGDSRAGQISCTSSTRFAITNFLKPGTFGPNERMRVSAWIKAGEGFQAEPNTPGFVLRVTMFTDEKDEGGGMAPAQDSSFYLGLNGTAVRGQNTAPFVNQEIPSEWTKVEGVFETSSDATKMNVGIFIWKGTGSLLVDDVEVEAVPDSVPLSPTQN